MKPITEDMRQLILTQRKFAKAELYTFTLVNGAQDYFTDIDLDIVHETHTFKSNSLRIEGLRYKTSVGLSVDEQDLRISAFPGEEIASADFFFAVQNGLLDGATIVRQRAFYAATGGPAYADYAQGPIPGGVITLFTGLVSGITKMGRTFTELKIKSPMKLLDTEMPRNTYQAGCLWTLYDAGCQAVRGDFTSSFTIDSVDSVSITPTTAISPANGADGIPFFSLGRLIFTSGDLINTQIFVEANDSAKLYLSYPLKVLPAPGDTFDVSAGCAKTGRGGACELKFNNLVHYRAFDRVPPVVVSV
jgi:uncharacterized phage protein (TIGR02218 family)